MHTRALGVDMIGIPIHTVREHRPNRGLAMPNFLVRVINQAVVCSAGFAALAGRPHEEASEIRVGRALRHDSVALVADRVGIGE